MKRSNIWLCFGVLLLSSATPLYGQQNPLRIAILHWYAANSGSSFAVGSGADNVAFDGANIWVADGGTPQPAGLFAGGTTIAVPLERPVRTGATVMVTEEKAGGAETPSQAPFLIVRNATQS